MLTICAVAIVLFLFGFFVEKDNGESTNKAAESGIVCGSLGSVLGLVAALQIGNTAPVVDTIAVSQSIATIRTTDDTVGAFVLGFGEVSSQTAYGVMVRNGDGSLSAKRIAGSSTRIFEDAQTLDSATLTVHAVIVDPDWSLRDWAVIVRRERDRYSELHVPAGSVRAAFDIKP